MSHIPDVKLEENLRSRELRVTAEAAYDCWAIEAPLWRYNQQNASPEPPTSEVTPEVSKEIKQLRQIRQFVEAIGQ